MVTLRLWLSDAVASLGVLGRIFRQEIWPARRLSPGVGVYYWRWSNPYVGPNWMRLLVCGVTVVTIIGIAILLLLLLVISRSPGLIFMSRMNSTDISCSF